MRPFLQNTLHPAWRRVVIQRAIQLFAVALICPGLFTFQARAEELTISTNASATSGAATLPDTVDLRSHFENWGLERRNQGKRNTCSVFTMTGALEYAAASKRHHGERFSVEFLNWGANKVAGEDQDGGFFSDLWSAYAKYGICLEKTLPYRDKFDPAMTPAVEILTEAKAQSALGLRDHWIKEWNVKTGLTDAQFLEIKRTLKEGWPVCGGFRWPRQVQWTGDVLGMCPPEAVFDGHSVLIVGYREDASQPGGGVLIFRNTNNGGRDGFMPYAYARSYMNDAIWVEAVGKEK